LRLGDSQHEVVIPSPAYAWSGSAPGRVSSRSVTCP